MYLITTFKDNTIAILAEVEDVLPEVNTTVASLISNGDITVDYIPLYFLKVKKIIRIKDLKGDTNTYTLDSFKNKKIKNNIRDTIEDKIIITVLSDDSYLFDTTSNDILLERFEEFNEIGGKLNIKNFIDFHSSESILYGINNEVSLKYAHMDYYRPESKTLMLDYSMSTFAPSTFISNAREFLRFITPTDVSVLSKIYSAGKKVYKDVLVENMSFPLLEYQTYGNTSPVSLSIYDMWNRMYDGDPSVPLEDCNVLDVEAFLENPAAFMLIPGNLRYSIIKYLKNDIEVTRLCGSREAGPLQEMTGKIKREVC